MMLTPRQAAEKVGVSVSLVYAWVESRQLAHYRVGAKGRRGAIRIAEADLAAFMEGLKVPAAAEEKRQAPPAPKPKLKLKHVTV
jgi:excisionase family DNA binding protein